jgi:hypothetical protein
VIFPKFAFFGAITWDLTRKDISVVYLQTKMRMDPKVGQCNIIGDEWKILINELYCSKAWIKKMAGFSSHCSKRVFTFCLIESAFISIWELREDYLKMAKVWLKVTKLLSHLGVRFVFCHHHYRGPCLVFQTQIYAVYSVCGRKEGLLLDPSYAPLSAFPGKCSFQSHSAPLIYGRHQMNERWPLFPEELQLYERNCIKYLQCIAISTMIFKSPMET